ncbi:hypothetical protein ACFW9F_08695 [Streptomyces sp. NPDC059506]|uniref:hypothetical protein n=1 Tax=Streptomyces TaxID=1883 RepID=UPI0015F9366D|nr:MULTISPECIES: hypothetical protein [unclassified Streptomyces]MCZ2524208.1 hypothetical protein [Streptomyces sp. HB2AG]QMV21769.1 hypothetical protein GQS52_08195 [Streptomyces sp. SCUT-3]
MRIELASEPGGPRPNEDFAAAALPVSGQGGALVVLDGVTPPAARTGCVHGVPWYVTRLGSALLELASEHSGIGLAECLSLAIGRTANAHSDSCDLSHFATPQATVVAVRWGEESVEHLVLSDSVLLLGSDDGVEAVLDERLARLRQRGPVLESMRNTEDGFHTAGVDPGVASRAVTGTRPRSRVRTVAVLTDGAARLVEVFGACDWDGALAALREEGPEAFVARVRAAEAADPEGARFPRGKASDDATAVLVEL